MLYRDYLVIATPNHDLQTGWIYIIFAIDGERIKASKEVFSTKQLAEEAAIAWIDLQSGERT
jgi:hypothetical protein